MRVLIVLAVLAAAAAPARAQEMDDDPCGSCASQPGFTRRDTLTGDWGGRRKALEDRGLTIAASYALETFAAPGLAGGCCSLGGVGALSLDLDLSHAARPLGTVHVTGFGIHGGGLSERIMDDYGVSNQVAPDDVRLFEAWYEQPIGPAAIRAGLLAADQEFVIARHGTVLVDATFGVISQFSDDLLGPVYPVAAPGVSAHAEGHGVAARVAVYDIDAVAVDGNSHGIPTAFGHHALVMGEVELDKMLKIGGWDHSDGSPGMYAVIDRGWTSHLGTFARAGVSPGAHVELYGDGGIRVVPWGARKRDFAGVGFAAMLIDHQEELVGEATYEWYATGWMTVQPDVQVVREPDRTWLVGALRATVVL